MLTFEKNPKDTSKFLWVTKTKVRVKEEDDIVISLANPSKQKPTRATIHFYNYTSMKVTGTEYVMYGIDGDRIYFAESDNISGFKLTTQTENRIAISQVTDPKFVEWCRAHIGGYKLRLDSSSGLYYAECRRHECPGN